MDREIKKSEFGEGFLYNLVLFAEHRWFMYEVCKDRGNFSLWIYAAADHLLGLDVPKRFRNKKIGNMVEGLQDVVLGLRWTDQFSQKDMENVFERLDDILIEVDKYLGVDDIRATWG